MKRKIKLLQEQADGAEEKAEKLQKELALERKAREAVRAQNDIKYRALVYKMLLGHKSRLYGGNVSILTVTSSSVDIVPGRAVLT